MLNRAENMAFNRALLSSRRMDWKTPKALHEALHKRFRFTCDPCPAKPERDGLSAAWGKRTYLNPPYGREIGQWIRKARQQAQQGKTVVALLPSRTDTVYWHENVMSAHELWFIKGRLHFDDGRHPAPFPSVLAIFKGKKRTAGPPEIMSVDTEGKPLGGLTADVLKRRTATP